MRRVRRDEAWEDDGLRVREDEDEEDEEGVERSSAVVVVLGAPRAVT